MFKMTMLVNATMARKPPYDVKPLTQLWRTIKASQVLRMGMLEYLKVVKIIIVQVLGNIKDECTSQHWPL
jgi:hypothetical protein